VAFWASELDLTPREYASSPTRALDYGDDSRGDRGGGGGSRYRTGGGLVHLCAFVVDGYNYSGFWPMKEKILYYGVGLLLGLAILVISQLPSQRAKMVVCDVGQGDAILITKGNNQILIDGGPSSEKVLSCLEHHTPFWDRTIELIVLTNTDTDHMQGLTAVVERYKVIQFVTADGVAASDSLTHLVKILEKREIVVHAVEQGDMIRVGASYGRSSLQFRVLWPPDTKREYVAVFSPQMDKANREQTLAVSAKRGNLNERSVVLYLLEDKKQILLMGDAGDQAEKVLVAEGNLPKVNILKVGHHGSKYASTEMFLQMIHPKMAVISVGAKNRYGHPTAETLARLKEVGSTIRRTDLEGEIVITL
jgi:competence protein ComEC